MRCLISPIPTILLGIHDLRFARPCELSGDVADWKQQKNDVHSLQIHRRMLDVEVSIITLQLRVFQCLRFSPV